MKKTHIGIATDGFTQQRLDVRTVGSLAVIALAFITVGVFFYATSRSVLHTMLQERLQSVAAMAAMQISANDVQDVRTKEDINNPAYTRLIRTLADIKSTIPHIQFVYILRQTEEPTINEFVADADAVLTEEELDENGNGEVDELEKPSLPGDKYDVNFVPKLLKEAYEKPTTDEEFTTDKWGTYISGYAPIITTEGEVLGTVGIDMEASTYLALQHRMFSPTTFILLIALSVIVAGVTVTFLWKRRYDILKQVDKERSWMAQLAMHQLGGPLTTFRFCTESIETTIDENTKTQIKDELRGLHSGIDRLYHIFNLLKAADTIYSRSLKYEPQKTTLHEVLHASIPPDIEKSHRFIQNICDDIPINIDKELIIGVIRELLENAMTYSKKGSEITLRAQQAKRNVLIQVQDQGVGVDRKEIEYIFERMYIGEEAWLHKPDAMGLGLYIAKGVIEAAGGEMWADSEKGKGFIITFTIPIDTQTQNRKDDTNGGAKGT